MALLKSASALGLLGLQKACCALMAGLRFSRGADDGICRVVLDLKERCR